MTASAPPRRNDVMMFGSSLLLLILVGVIVWFVLQSRGAGSAVPGQRTEETPEEIARRRYALGEIDREEYDQILKDLGR